MTMERYPEVRKCVSGGRFVFAMGQLVRVRKTGEFVRIRIRMDYPARQSYAVVASHCRWTDDLSGDGDLKQYDMEELEEVTVANARA